MDDWRAANKGRSYEDIIAELHHRVVTLERLLLVVLPDSKYPALVEAYKEYKVLERLTLTNEET